MRVKKDCGNKSPAVQSTSIQLPLKAIEACRQHYMVALPTCYTYWHSGAAEPTLKKRHHHNQQLNTKHTSLSKARGQKGAGRGIGKRLVLQEAGPTRDAQV